MRFSWFKQLGLIEINNATLAPLSLRGRSGEVGQLLRSGKRRDGLAAWQVRARIADIHGPESWVTAVSDGLYDELADSFHLIFDDWDAAIVRQRDVLAKLLPVPATGRRIVDCACGIGTQSIGLAMLGYAVEGSDLSPASVDRACREALARGLTAGFRIDDMREFSAAPIAVYDAVIAMDNAIPHLESDDEIETALPRGLT